MSVHIEVVLGIQARSRLDDAETLVTGIEGHICTASELGTCQTEMLVFNMTVLKVIKKQCCGPLILLQTNIKSRNKIQMGVVTLIMVLDEHLGLFWKEKTGFSYKVKTYYYTMEHLT